MENIKYENPIFDVDVRFRNENNFINFQIHIEHKYKNAETSLTMNDSNWCLTEKFLPDNQGNLNILKNIIICIINKYYNSKYDYTNMSEDLIDIDKLRLCLCNDIKTYTRKDKILKLKYLIKNKI